MLYAAEKGYVAYTNCTSTLVRIFLPCAQWAVCLGEGHMCDGPCERRKFAIVVHLPECQRYSSTLV